MKSDPVLDRLLTLHPKRIDLTLERVERLLAALDHPETKLPPVVHVAGTNGKGSVIAYLRAMLEAAGYRVHAYTSPHLVRFHERIRLSGQLIDDDALTAILEECERANAGAPITFFEITTAAAFLAFTRTSADIVLLETGLGGRLDATNVVAAPALTCITPVSEDHQSFLGDDIGSIAAEKAGIIKSGVPLVVAAQGTRKAQGVIASHAKDKGAATHTEGKDWHVRKAPDGMLFEKKGDGDEATSRLFPAPALAGRHQVQNAGLAIACVDALQGFTVDDGAIAVGLRSVDWPARLQRLTRGPLVEGLPDGVELWLDGGHNPAAAAAIAGHARAWRGTPLHMVLGMLNSKDVSGYLKGVAPRLASLHAVTIPGEENAVPAEDIAGTATALGLDAVTADSIGDAVAAIVARHPAPLRILIAGSLYLAGHVLADNA